MKKIPIGANVKISGVANQYPHERIEDEGEIIDNKKGYLVRLFNLKENLIFKRSEIKLWK